MGNAYFMGIDTGTNSSKGVLMDESGPRHDQPQAQSL